MTILEFLQGVDNEIDYENTAVVVFSANSIKCQDTSEIWGVNLCTLTNKQVTSYFGSPLDDSLSYEGITRTQVNESVSPVAGLREAFTKLFKQSGSDKLFLVSCNSKGWTQRVMDMFKDYDIIPKGKEVHHISLQILHNLHTNAFLANSYAEASDMQAMSEDAKYSRSLPLKKLQEIYQVNPISTRAACEERCRTMKEITTDLFESWVKEEE